MKFVPLPRSFYRPSAGVVAPALLGHFLIRSTEAGICGGPIVESEAYLCDDPACHGYGGQTARNRTMYGPYGRAYIYFIYGNHWCFNTVCQPEGIAEAVLVRAIEPLFGEELMLDARPVESERLLTNGPAKLCQAMNIDGKLDGSELFKQESGLYVARNPKREELLTDRGPMITTTRVGISKAAELPLRFYLAGSLFVSRRARANELS